jgi:hypothetical protein
MNERHKTPRHAPVGQRAPLGRGWNRAYWEEERMTIWKLWRPTKQGCMLVGSVYVTDVDVALTGRKKAADRLRKIRKELAMREAAQ